MYSIWYNDSVVLERNAEINFQNKDTVRFSAAYIGFALLSKNTWEDITSRKHSHVQYNLPLVKATLASPCLIKRSQHKKDKDTVLFHKPIEKYYLKPGCSVTGSSVLRYFRVVVNKDTKYIETMFPTDKIKGGEKLWP